LNIVGLQRIRERLKPDVRERLLIGVYEQTVRFNIMLVDDHLCIAQPYLPHGRGVDAPTLVIRRQHAGSGVYSTFERIFTGAWEQARFV
jgi:hypothetical protein